MNIVMPYNKYKIHYLPGIYLRPFANSLREINDVVVLVSKSLVNEGVQRAVSGEISGHNQ